MKEIKAYIRPAFINSTIQSLEEAGAKDMTLIRVDAIGPLADQEMDRWHVLRKYAEKYSAVAKLEIVCSDEQVPRFIEIITEHARTGEHGDGRIFVASVERAYNVRTGDEGEAAL